MANDPLRLEYGGMTPDEIEELETPNELLDTLVTRFECEEYLQFANRIVWLAAVKEVLGYIPDWFQLTYSEIRGLVILHDETSKKLASDSWRQKEESQKLRTRMPSVSVPRIPLRRSR